MYETHTYIYTHTHLYTFFLYYIYLPFQGLYKEMYNIHSWYILGFYIFPIRLDGVRPELSEDRTWYLRRRRARKVPVVRSRNRRGRKTTALENIGVSKNRGTPKWMVYNGKPWKTLLKWMIWGYHYFWKHPHSVP